MKPASLVFFSSSSIALPLFKALLEDSRFKVQGLVTAPDASVGRGQKIQESELKKLAQEKGVSVFQPEKLSAAMDLLGEFERNRPDFLLTFSYGQLLNGAWLSLPRRAPLNVHPSLLPRHRGPTPPQGALLAGDTKTGITLMKMVITMDAGPLAFQHAFDISTVKNCGELYEAIAERAAEWIPDDVFRIFENEGFEFQIQDESGVTFTQKFGKEDAFEDFKRSSEDVLRRFKAFTPRPGLWTRCGGKRMKLCLVRESEEKIPVGKVKEKAGRIWVGTKSFAVEVLELQMEGKNKVSASEFLRGQADFAQAVLPS